MAVGQSGDGGPLVSVILATCDRPRFLATALACYRQQTYPRRELIVVDDGAQAPADAAAVASAGGRLVRVEPGTPLGAKLNRGVAEARGTLCQKMDDDDWYAPEFLETMVRAVVESRRVVCRPTLAFLQPFLFFDVARWEVRASERENVPGATLLFAREDWEARPFRALPRDEDFWFFWDQTRMGVAPLPVRALESFLAVRHAADRTDRGHTWTRQWDGQTLERYLLDRPLHDRRPEVFLPDWALAFYRSLRRETAAQMARHVDGDEVTRQTVGVLDRPHLATPETIRLAEQWIAEPRRAADDRARALGLLAAVAYGRPDLIGDGTAAALASLFADPTLPPECYAAAAGALGLLLPTPAAHRVVLLLLDLLARPGREPGLYRALLDALREVAWWSVGQLALESVVAVAECQHLAALREDLLHGVIERVLFADPGTLAEPLFRRLEALYEASPSFKYCRAYLAGRRDASPAMREAAAPAESLFPTRQAVAARLGAGVRRVLVVQNIRDGQGDEIIRVVPLVQALLDANPRLEVVLATGRGYLYAHPRVRPIPIDDRERVRAALEERFDAVVDFYESDVPQLNYDPRLEEAIAAHVAARPPFLHVAARKGWGGFVYQRVDVDSRPHAEALALDRQRVDNQYETTFRLIVELGLPLRMGEDRPATEPVLAGLPWPEAEAAWAALLAGNAGHPVALFGPFGGTDPLKGYVERTMDDLADRIRELLAEGYFVVLQPNGTAWGSSAHARQALDQLAPSEREQVAIGPDPSSDSEGPAGAGTARFAGPVTRLVTYFIRFADLVVAVEGWMMHAAYCLGKPCRVLMQPYSPTEWFPYGRTRRQDVLIPGPRPRPAGFEAAPPLPERPRKAALLYALGCLRGRADERAVPLLRRALLSEDREIRRAAAEVLGALPGPRVIADLVGLLDDSCCRVRAAAASALLERDTRAWGIHPEHLLAHRAIGGQPRDWAAVMGLGAAARDALERATRDDDPVVRREAAEMLRALDGLPADE